jgi:hypothetical protein
VRLGPPRWRGSYTVDAGAGTFLAGTAAILPNQRRATTEACATGRPANLALISTVAPA